VGFTQILALGRQNKMTGSAEQYQYILRDESMPLPISHRPYQPDQDGEPDLWTQNSPRRFRASSGRRPELELSLSEDTMPRGVLGSSSDVQGIPALHRPIAAASRSAVDQMFPERAIRSWMSE